MDAASVKWTLEKTLSHDYNMVINNPKTPSNTHNKIPKNNVEAPPRSGNEGHFHRTIDIEQFFYHV